MTRRTLIVLVSACVLATAFFLWPSRYPVRNAPLAAGVIVCFGDSLTYGTGAPTGSDYPSRLGSLLGRPVVNLGRPGDTTATALTRLDKVLALKPAAVLLTLGGNDLKNGVHQAAARANLSEIIGRIQDQGGLVVLGGIDIPLYGRGYDDMYQELARETGSVLVENVFKNIFGRRELMSDPIHPNADGYRIMAEHFAKALEPYLAD